jgi:hypothetical protein
LSEEESERIVRWLTTNEDRLLVVDAVYTYEFETSRRTLEPLLATDRCIVAWSCSKSWLTPGALGVARMPASWAPLVRDLVPPPDLSRDLSRGQSIIDLLEERPDLPGQQALLFRQEWARLESRIRSAEPEWRPPLCGYFGTLAVRFETLLQDHGILSIPASVFGSEAEDLSVISCLYDMASHQLEAASA